MIEYAVKITFTVENVINVKMDNQKFVIIWLNMVKNLHLELFNKLIYRSWKKDYAWRILSIFNNAREIRLQAII